MQQHLHQYMHHLIAERSAQPGLIAVSARNAATCSVGSQKLMPLTQQIAEHLDCAAVIAAKPADPFSMLLLQRSLPNSDTLFPRDSESHSFLHDIPLVRSQPSLDRYVDAICTALARRKGCIAEGIGIISQGNVTVEQAYIAWSSVLHASFIKYFEDLLTNGPLLPGEQDIVTNYKSGCLMSGYPEETGLLRKLPIQRNELLRELCQAGKLTVQLGLVDSFFGNISCRSNGLLCISQTSARLDSLTNQIDMIPADGSSTAGLTASSELPAHRALYAATGCTTVLHGHPRFPVIMSFFGSPVGQTDLEITASIPVVAGEGGVGGLAEQLAEAFLVTGASAVIVRGHGVFTIGKTGFNEAMRALILTDQNCRAEYFRLLHTHHQIE